jgi:hypothetical protein
MRELRDKGMSKPYRDRRKRSKYTKSVNVPYFPQPQQYQDQRPSTGRGISTPSSVYLNEAFLYKSL